MGELMLVEPIDPADVDAWRMSPSNAQDVVEAITAAAKHGYASKTETFVQPNSADPVTGLPFVLWTVTLTHPECKQIVIRDSEWLVDEGLNMKKYKPAQFVTTFHCDTPLVWDESAPVVEVLPSDQVSVAVPLPTSPCGPFTFSVQANDLTADSSAALNVVSETVDAETGVVTLLGDGLITGHDYTFTVTVDTEYEYSATSEPSVQVTAIL